MNHPEAHRSEEIIKRFNLSGMVAVIIGTADERCGAMAPALVAAVPLDDGFSCYSI